MILADFDSITVNDKNKFVKCNISLIELINLKPETLNNHFLAER